MGSRSSVRLEVLRAGWSNCCATCMWQLRALVNRGELDRLLVRPVSPLLQLNHPVLQHPRPGQRAAGGVVLAQAVRVLNLHWGVGDVLLLGVTLSTPSC